MRVALPTLPTTCQDGGGRGEGKPAAARSQRCQRQGQGERDGGTTQREMTKSDKEKHERQRGKKTMETINGMNGSVRNKYMNK